MLSAWLRFSPDVISDEIRKTIELDIGLHTVRGSGKVFILYFLFLLGTQVYTDRPVLTAVVAINMVFIVAIRFYLYKAHAANRLPEWLKWRPAFAVLNLLVALGWGLIAAVIVYDHGLTFRSYFALVMLLGLSSGSTLRLSIDRPLAHGVIISTLFPLVIALAVRVNNEAAYIMIVTVCFGVAFFISNINHAYQIIWRAILSQERIRLQKDQLNTVLNAVPGFVCWIGPDNQCLGINDRLAESLEPSLRERVKDSSQVLSFEKLSAAVPELNQIFMNFKASSVEKEMREIRIPYGRSSHWHLATLQKFGPAARPYVLLMSLDINEQKQMQEQFEQARVKSMEAARLSSLGVLASGVAHEVNNPLAILKGSVDLFRDYAESNEIEKSLKVIDRFESTIDRIARIIKGLLALGHDNSHLTTYDHVSLRELLENVQEVYSSQINGHQIDFRVGDFPADLLVEGQHSQIGQILISLVNNAIEAIEPLQEKWIHIDVNELPQSVVVSIEDSGSGIPPEVAQQIFNPFFTTKPIGKGMGLGLSISRSTAEKHGGELTLDSHAKHTRFLLTLRKAMPKSNHLVV